MAPRPCPGEEIIVTLPGGSTGHSAPAAIRGVPRPFVLGHNRRPPFRAGFVERLSSAGGWHSHCAGLGGIRAGFRAAGHGLGEHERSGGRSSLRSRSAGPVASKPRVHQSWPRVRISVSSTSHPGSPPSPGARAAMRSLASENRLIRRLLRTASSRPPHRCAGGAGGRETTTSARTPSVRGRGRPPRGFRAAAVHLYLQRPAPADLDRQPAQPRIQQVGVLA